MSDDTLNTGSPPPDHAPCPACGSYALANRTRTLEAALRQAVAALHMHGRAEGRHRALLPECTERMCGQTRELLAEEAARG